MQVAVAPVGRCTLHGANQSGDHWVQVLRGNPLVQAAPDQELNFGVKRRWDDDVVFKNQDRGAPKKQQRFINDTIRFVRISTAALCSFWANTQSMAVCATLYAR